MAAETWRRWDRRLVVWSPRLVVGATSLNAALLLLLAIWPYLVDGPFFLAGYRRVPMDRVFWGMFGFALLDAAWAWGVFRKKGKFGDGFLLANFSALVVAAVMVSMSVSGWFSMAVLFSRMADFPERWGGGKAAGDGV